MNDPYLHIEEYILGQLNETDRATFELKLKEDKALRNELALMKDAQAISQDLLELELRNILNGISNERDTDSPGKPNRSKWWIAPVTIVLLISGYFLMEKLLKSAAPASYADVYETPNWPIVRGGQEDLLSTGISAAINGDLQSGIQIIKKSDNETAVKNYWIAELFASTEQADSSLYYIQQITDANYKSQRIAYLEILAYYKLGNTEKLKQLIDSLDPNTDKWYLDRYAKLID